MLGEDATVNAIGGDSGQVDDVSEVDITLGMLTRKSLVGIKREDVDAEGLLLGDVEACEGEVDIADAGNDELVDEAELVEAEVDMDEALVEKLSVLRDLERM